MAPKWSSSHGLLGAGAHRGSLRHRAEGPWEHRRGVLAGGAALLALFAFCSALHTRTTAGPAGGSEGWDRSALSHMVFLFAAHDPGANNHIRPIYDLAAPHAAAATYADLRQVDTAQYNWQAALVARAVRPSIQGSSMRVMVVGASAPEKGWPLEVLVIRAAREQGFRVVQVIENGVGVKRLATLDEGSAADYYLLTTPIAVPQMQERLRNNGLLPRPMTVTGSAHYERFKNQAATTAPALSLSQVREGLYGVPAGAAVAAYFSAPVQPSEGMEARHVEALLERLLRALEPLPALLGRHLALVVRPHPRTPPDLARAQKQICRDMSSTTLSALYDDTSGEGSADNISVLNAANVTITPSSASAIESVLMGTPAAFWKDGWPGSDAFLGNAYAWVTEEQVPRLRTADHLQAWLAAALLPGGAARRTEGTAPGGDPHSSRVARREAFDAGSLDHVEGSADRAVGALVNFANSV